MFYVIKGNLEIRVTKNKYALEDITYLTDGDYTTVSPTEKHYFKAVSDVEALEIYYPEPLSEDILRENVGRVTQDSYKLGRAKSSLEEAYIKEMK